MRRHNLDVIVAILVIILNIGWSLLSVSQPILGTLLTLPLLFVIPGYLVTEILFQKRQLGVTYRIVLTMTVSICVVILSGFLLNILSGGLNTRFWIISLGSLNTILGLLAILQRRNFIIYRKQVWSIRLKFSGYILLGLALVITIASLYYSVISVYNQPHPGFTQLWLLPAKEANNTWQLNLGVRSNELAPITYNVTMSVNHTVFKSWPSITLDPEQEWDQFVSFSVTRNKSTYVEVKIYKTVKTNIIYQEVHSTLYK